MRPRGRPTFRATATTSASLAFDAAPPSVWNAVATQERLRIEMAQMSKFIPYGSCHVHWRLLHGSR